MAQQEITSNELFGIAKKFNEQIEALPLHTHSAIVEMVKVGMQHRQLAMQHANKVAQEEQQERIIKIKEFEMQQAQRAHDSGVKLVPDPPPN